MHSFQMSDFNSLWVQRLICTYLAQNRGQSSGAGNSFCIPESFNTNISHQFFDYKITNILFRFHPHIFVNLIKRKAMTFDHDFCFLFSFSSSLFFLGRNRKGEENNQSRGQKSYFSARPVNFNRKRLVPSNHEYNV